MHYIADIAKHWGPFCATLLIGIFILYFVQKLFSKWSQKSVDNNKLYYQLALLLMFNFLLVLGIINAPFSETIKSQLLSLLGITYTAAIALSSTTFLGNILAGLMLKVLNKMRPGEFVKIGENFGRITELGLLHTEIQTADRDLTTLPNLYLVTNPVKVMRSSGTVISEDISLGYDIHHNKIEKHLINAAINCKLEEPFMHIQQLGDYSVTYRISGFLKDVKNLLSVKAKLRENILDSLHDAKIEIISPNFMNQRVYPAHEKFIPSRVKDFLNGKEEQPENIIFDKAEEAETIENLKSKLEEIEKEISSVNKDAQMQADKKELLLNKINERKSKTKALIEKKMAISKE